MKRDCGMGELIPNKFEVVHVIGQSDDENVSEFDTLEQAKTEFDKVAILVKQTKCSDARLYVKDKKGYANCILMLIHMNDGRVELCTNRIAELSSEPKASEPGH